MRRSAVENLTDIVTASQVDLKILKSNKLPTQAQTDTFGPEGSVVPIILIRYVRHRGLLVWLNKKFKKVKKSAQKDSQKIAILILLH